MLNARQFLLATENYSLMTLVALVNNGTLALRHEFARSPNEWSEAKKSRYIESILMQVPIQPFYLSPKPIPYDNSKGETWTVIDGVQRLKAITQFMSEAEDSLILVGLTVAMEFDGRRYKDLNINWRRRLERYTHVHYLTAPAMPYEERKDFFYRMQDEVA